MKHPVLWRVLNSVGCWFHFPGLATKFSIYSFASELVFINSNILNVVIDNFF
jgi:hypothetical protein